NGEVEAAAATQLALEPDASTVQLHEPPRNRQAEPGTVVSARWGRVHLREFHEYQVVVLGSDPDSSIADLEEHRGSERLLGCGCTNPDSPPGGGEGDRISQEIRYHMRELLTVGLDRWNPLLELQVEFETLPVAESLIELPRLPEHVVQAHRGTVQRQLIGGPTSVRENLPDHAE